MNTASMLMTLCILVLVLALEFQVNEMKKKLDALLRRKPRC
jgi:hypothetical protein